MSPNYERFCRSIKNLANLGLRLTFPIALLLIGLIMVHLKINDINLLPLEIQNYILGVIVVLVGVFIPLQIEAWKESKAEKKKLKDVLATIWFELRAIQYKLRLIKSYYKYQELKNTFNGDVELLLSAYANKSHFILNLSYEISFNAYYAAISSGYFTSLDNDDLYNGISGAYESVDSFLTMTQLVTGGIECLNWTERENIQQLAKKDISIDAITIIINSRVVRTDELIKKCYAELLQAIDRVDKSILCINTNFKRLGVEPDEIEGNYNDLPDLP